MTLRNAAIGKRYTVTSLDLDMVTMRRLEALGLTRGTNVKVLNRNRGDAIIIMVRGTRLALGKAIADSIQAKEVQE